MTQPTEPDLPTDPVLPDEDDDGPDHVAIEVEGDDAPHDGLPDNPDHVAGEGIRTDPVPLDDAPEPSPAGPDAQEGPQ